jgi:hypothetical protein
MNQTNLRPKDLAHLLLAGSDLLPRQRARDQQSDLVGLELKRRVLLRLAALDPEPEDFDAALAQIITYLGPPYGPTRGICLSVRYDWEAACSSPQFVAWLLEEAVREGEGQRKGKKRAHSSDP